MKIQVERCSYPGTWWESRVGEVFEVRNLEINRRPDQGIPCDVYWVRTGGPWNTLNYVPVKDTSIVSMKVKDLPEDQSLRGVKFVYPKDGKAYFFHSQWQKGIWAKLNPIESRIYPLHVESLQEVLEWEVVS